MHEDDWQTAEQLAGVQELLDEYEAKLHRNTNLKGKEEVKGLRQKEASANKEDSRVVGQGKGSGRARKAETTAGARNTKENGRRRSSRFGKAGT